MAIITLLLANTLPLAAGTPEVLVSVEMIHSDGTPRWVSVESATLADVDTVRRLGAARQLTGQEVCRQSKEAEASEEEDL